MFGDFRLEPCLDAEASRVAHYSSPAALLRLTFSVAANGLTGWRPDLSAVPQTGRARRGRNIGCERRELTMSEQEQNIELIKKGYEAFNAGDGDTVMSLFDDNIEWIQPGDSAISGTYHGKQEVAELLAKMGEKQTSVSNDHILADGDLVVMLGQTTVAGETTDAATVFTVRGGQTVRVQAYGDTAALERIFGKKEVATA